MSAPTYSFRWLNCLEPEHAERYLQLFLRVLQQDTTVGFPGPFDAATGQRVAQDLDRELRAGRAHLLVAEEGGRFLFQATLVQSGSPNNRHMASIFRAMVDPSERGQGLMWQTLPMFLSKCQSLGVELVTIDVRAGSPAEKIWKHMGCTPYGVLPGYSRVNGQSYDGIYMYMSVPQAIELVRQRKLG